MPSVSDLAATLWQLQQFLELGEAERTSLQKLLGTPPELLPEKLAYFYLELCQNQGLAADFFPTNAQYSSEIQLNVLGISLTKLAQPVLDLGCGFDATLVRYLQAKGLDAWGLDRVLHPSLRQRDKFLEESWEQAPLISGRWGSIISHMAFSNHARHLALRSEARAAEAFKRLQKILEALAPQGVFYFAPGVPSFEAQLSNKDYLIVRRALPGSEGDGLYATQVHKR